MNFQTLFNNTTTKRDTLKPAFNVGEIPTQQHFYDMIDGLFLQDDTVYKDANNGLAIQAGTDANKTALLLYSDATSEPAWQLGIANGFELKDTTGNTQLMVTNDGKVGIGTTSPSIRMDVKQEAPGIVLSAETTTLAGTAGYTGLSLKAKDQDNTTSEWILYNSIANGYNGVGFFDPAASAYRLFINKGSGNVGIGTTNPGTSLHLTNGSGSTWLTIDRATSNEDSGIMMKTANEPDFFIYTKSAAVSNSFQLIASGLTGESGDNPRLRLPKDNKDLYFALSGGKVGIGTTNPRYKLDIDGNVRLTNVASSQFSGMLYFHSLDGDYARIFSEKVADNQIKMVIEVGDDGNQDSVVIRNRVWSDTDGGLDVLAVHRSYVQVTGHLYYTVGASQNSDIVLKKNIKPMSGDMMRGIYQLQGNTYQWRTEEFKEKNFSEGTQLGFIAQDMQKVFPELVNEDKDGYLSINYTGLIPVLTEAHKQQQKTIESQQAQIDNLVERMVALENLLAATQS